MVSRCRIGSLLDCQALDSDSVANNFINAFMMVAFRVKIYAYPNSADLIVRIQSECRRGFYDI